MKKTLTALYALFVLILAVMYLHAKIIELQQPASPQVSIFLTQLQQRTTEIQQDVINTTHLKVEVSVTWTGSVISQILVTFSDAPKSNQVQTVTTAILDSVQKRSHQAASSFQIFIVTATEYSSILPSLLAWISFGAGLVFLGKIADTRIKGRRDGLKPYKARFERYFRTIANQNWNRMLFRAIVNANRAAIKLFGDRIFSIHSVSFYILFSLIFNLYLSYLPLMWALPVHVRLIMFESTKFLLVPLAISVINLPLDFLAYVMTRKMFEQGLRSKLPSVFTISGILVIGWLFAGLSTSAGAALSNITLIGNPLDRSNWQSIVFPLFANWFSSGMLHPLQSNIKINNFNMGYVALGTLPMCSLLLSALTCMFLWRCYPAIIVGEMRLYLSVLLKDEKSHFEMLGYVATIIPIIITLLIRYIYALMAQY